MRSVKSSTLFKPRGPGFISFGGLKKGSITFSKQGGEVVEGMERCGFLEWHFFGTLLEKS
jgi:hypothetical protein